MDDSSFGPVDRQARPRATAGHREDYVGATYLSPGDGEPAHLGRGRLHNAPAEVTSFVGRRRELAQVKAALAGARLVTLTGPGGVGKTRLALRSAAELERNFDGGAWLVELAELADAGLLAQSVARALDLRDESGRWPVAMLTDHIGSRRLLLVLDNCEHVLEASAVLCDALVRACPGLHILATSRQPLGVYGESTLAVPSLPVPGREPDRRPWTTAGGDAVALFAERAAATLPGFSVTAENAALVAEVCARLDGIPLAIELAAVTLRALTLEQIRDRLDDRLGLLTGGARAGRPRQRTLRATIDWSHDLLSQSERVLWRRLSVFPGSFGLDAAEAVCGGAGLPAGDVLPGLTGLVEKSVVARDGSRHRLLETLRAYARERLREAGEEAELPRAHRDWCAALAARARPEWTGPEQVQWFDRLAAEHASVRAALEFSLSAPGEAEAGLALACDLWLYWQARGHVGEGRRWLGALLEAATDLTAVRARALWVAGYLGLAQGDVEAAEALLGQSLALAHRLGSEGDLAFANQYLGQAALFRGDMARAADLFRSAVDLHRRLSEPTAAFALSDLAIVTMMRGEPERAEALFEESIAAAAASGDRWTRSHALWGFGLLSLEQGRADRARDLLREALELMRTLDERTGIALGVEALAWIAGAQGDAERAARLIGATQAVWESIPSSLPPVLSAHHEACERRARSRLGAAEFDRARRAGAALTREAAVAYALEEETPAQPSTPLTERERQVARLVAAGLTDREIAARLVISVRTAETHVGHILAKLGLWTRTQVAVAWAGAGEAASFDPGGAGRPRG